MYRREGATAAIRKFAASIGVHHDRKQSSIELTQENIRVAENNRESFFKYDVGAASHYTLDIGAMKTVPTQIVIAGRRDGRKYFPYLCAASLADHLGIAITEFPGTHAGFLEYPKEFAEKLMEVLGD